MLLRPVGRAGLIGDRGGTVVDEERRDEGGEAPCYQHLLEAPDSEDQALDEERPPEEPLDV
jgi:hypothetical protein